MRSLRLIVLLAACRAGGDPRPATPEGPLGLPEISDRLELLGEPFREAAPFARNVWDMRAWDGRLYLGHGDLVGNAGPVDVVSYSPAARVFRVEATIPDEQIDRFVVIRGRLAIPGADPQEDWSHGNFFVLEDGRWIKNRTVPGGVHMFDLAEHRGELYAALGSVDDAETVWRSADAVSWTPVPLPPGWPRDWFGRRAHALVQAGGSLLVSTRFGLARLDGTTLVAVGPWLPGLSPPPGARTTYVTRHAAMGGQAAMLASTMHPDRTWPPSPVGVVVTDGERFGRLDIGALVVRDLRVRGGRLLLLAHEPAPDAGPFRMYLLASDDLQTTRPLVTFEVPTFARSFEVLDRHLYLGLGSDAADAHPAAGQILRAPFGEPVLPRAADQGASSPCCSSQR